MKAPLDEEEDEEPGPSQTDENAAENAKGDEKPLRFKDKYNLDVDGEFRKGIHTRFRNWQEVIKIANEVHLDEMRVLLEWGPQRQMRGARACANP